MPHLIRNVIDAVTSGYVANQVLDGLGKIPAAFMSVALPNILEATGKDASLTLDQLKVQLAADINNAPRHSYQCPDLHPHLRRLARSLRFFADLLGGKKFAICRL